MEEYGKPILRGIAIAGFLMLAFPELTGFNYKWIAMCLALNVAVNT